PLVFHLVLHPSYPYSFPTRRSSDLSGVCISIYTLADREGVRLISPVTYNLYVFIMMALGTTPFVLLTSRRLTARSELRAVSRRLDRKSTRLNSSHVSISYAVFCLKK